MTEILVVAVASLLVGVGISEIRHRVSRSSSPAPILARTPRSAYCRYRTVSYEDGSVRTVHESCSGQPVDMDSLPTAGMRIIRESGHWYKVRQHPKHWASE